MINDERGAGRRFFCCPDCCSTNSHVVVTFTRGSWPNDSTISFKEDEEICWSQAGSVQKRRLWSSKGNVADRGQTTNCSDVQNVHSLWCKWVSCRRDATHWKVRVWHQGHAKLWKFCATRIADPHSPETLFHRSSESISHR